MNAILPTIVVIDDDAETVAFLVDFFDLLGVVAVGCAHGPHAPACIKEHRPDIVILDVLLPGMTGVDVLHALHADPTMQRVPVIFFSGSEDHLRRLLPNYPTYGATFVLKPQIEQLSATVQRLLAQSA